MKKMFLRSLLISLGLLFVPFVQTGEPRESFGHMGEPGHVTDPTIDQARIAADLDAAEALRLERIQQQVRAPHHTEDHIGIHQKPKTPGETTQITADKGTASDDSLTDEELAALKAAEHYSFNDTKTSPGSDHLADHPTQLNSIRPNIIQHLKNELAIIREKLSPEQIKNREMVIEFFHKAGELTEENLVRFHNVYEKLNKLEEGTELTLTPEEQKEMKLFLQSLISTYCTTRQSVERTA